MLEVKRVVRASGCPPRPEMVLDSIVKLHDKIQNMKLGASRENQITELDQARLRRQTLKH